MKPIIDLKQDTLEIKCINIELNQAVKQHKEDLLDSVQDAPQRVIIRRYLSILQELCRQACACLDAKAYSTLEALSRVIMEQSANMLYISMDGGSNARALLRSSKQLTESNGKAWANYLASQSAANPAAQARQVSGAAMLERIDKRWPDIKRYPGGKGLFSALGWESHYYAFYLPLCDSVHSFSDEMSALVDFSDLYSISEAEAEKSLAYWNRERLRLAIYHYVVAIGLRTEAFSRCCSSLAPDLHETSSEGLLKKIKTLIMRHDIFDHSRLKEMESGTAKPDEFLIKI